MRRAVTGRLAILFHLSLLFRVARVATRSVNQTIDDDLGDSLTGLKPRYAPGDGWAQGAECSGCNINTRNVDVSRVQDGTWHDSTHHPGDPDRVITVAFTGTAVYVFHLIANSFPSTTTFTNLTFHIDGEYVGNYTHIPDSSLDRIMYRVPVYANETLSNTQHTFETRTSGTIASLILFDFIVYTFDDGTSDLANPSTPSESITPATELSSSQQQQAPTPIGAIVGGAVGGFFVLVSIVVVILYLRRRRRRQGLDDQPKIEPFTIDGDPREPAGEPASRRFSRAPKLPDLRMGRTRLMPGPGSSTTGTGEP